MASQKHEVISELTMASQKHKDNKKIVGLIFGIFECLLTQNQLIKLLNFLDSFKFYERLSLDLKTGGSRKLFLLESDFKTCSEKLLMPFIVWQTFKVKLFLENSLLSNILNHLKTKVTL